MKTIISITPIHKAEVDLGELASWLGFQADEVQATFLNVFVKQLQVACTINGGSIAMQCHYISKYLSADAKYFLSSMLETEELEK